MGLTEAGSHISPPASGGRIEPSTVPTNLTEDTPHEVFQREPLLTQKAISTALSEIASVFGLTARRDQVLPTR